jgi:predicted nucleotidyltransferase
MVLPKDKQETLDRIVADLQKIEGLLAIVLGGSYAAGAANPGSNWQMSIIRSSLIL